MARYFEAATWAAVPFHFWSTVFFCFGAVVGSFLNVCIYRMPRNESIISPPSHCPNCKYSIPWYLNLPLFTWLFLRGRCANCQQVISARYFLVELLTAVAFLGCWLGFGRQSVGMVLVYCLLLSMFIVATFIDFEHFIIPDEITFGGIAAGFLCSFAVPGIHGATTAVGALQKSVLGIVVGAGLIYVILRIGKLLFGRQHVQLAANTRVIFTETALLLPGQQIPYEDLFYRKTDTIHLHGKIVEMIDRCYRDVPVRLSPDRLLIAEEEFNPEQTPHLEVVADDVVLPREAMGFGDVKFMAAIGAFLGWQATIFSLMASSMIGATVGILLIALKKQAWSSRLPYGPYIALAATIWIFAGQRIVDWVFTR